MGGNGADPPPQPIKCDAKSTPDRQRDLIANRLARPVRRLFTISAWDSILKVSGVVRMKSMPSPKEGQAVGVRLGAQSHIVSANNSRPISMRRISDVPAPISYSLASRHNRPSGYSLM